MELHSNHYTEYGKVMAAGQTKVDAHAAIADVAVMVEDKENMLGCGPPKRNSDNESNIKPAFRNLMEKPR